MFLSEAVAGHQVRVESAALPAQLARRLAELGVRPGQSVTVSHRTAGGGRVVQVGDARIALDSRTARAISVVAEDVDHG